MFSPCGFSHTLPHHGDYIPYPHQHYPGWEPVSAPTKVESQGPLHFAPWSVDGSANSPSPVDYHPWCSHSYPVGYYGFRPQFPHIPPHTSHHSQLHCPGPFPCYLNSYPYLVTHPYYPADQAPHGHSSSETARCSVCPNHTCNRRDGSVKIEEQKSENDMDNESSSLIQIPNCPYPVFWIPPGYSNKDTDNGFESYLPVRNGWIPMNQGGDGQNSLQTDRRNQFPWPVVWMPSDQDAINHIGKKLDGDRQKSLQFNEKKNQLPWPIVWMPQNQNLDAEKGVREITSNPKPEENQSSKLKIIPLKFLEDENLGEKLGDSHAHSETVAEKETRTKTIPVRHAEEINDKKLNTEGKLRDKEEKLLNTFEGKDNAAKKASDLKQSSHAKISKLPPVCLRVDPLPKKKSNGSSRSPSPPSHNDREKTHEDKMEKQHLTKRDPDKMPDNQMEVPHVNDKFIVRVEAPKEKIQDIQSTSSKDEARKVVDNQLPNKGTKLDTEEVKTEVLKHAKEDSEEAIEKTLCESDVRKRHVDNTERISGKQEEKRKILSFSEAATLIQSAYRGFEVRRWQPLEKLRRIVQVREKAEVVKRQIQEFEASSEGQDSKRKAILCETIMNLLLQLDAIQGLHQSLRDMRKSLARELVDLQEKLDSLGPTTTMEHGKMTGCRTSDMGTGGESTSSDVSSGRINLEPKPVSSDPDEVANSSELTYLDGKASIVPRHSGIMVLPSESLSSASSLENLDPSNVERNLNPLTETQIDLPNEQLHCPGVSHSVEKDQVSQEVIKSSASASPEDFVTSFTTENKDKLEEEIGGEAIDTSEEQVRVGAEFSHPMLENDATDGLVLEKSSTLPVEAEGETTEIATEILKSEMADIPTFTSNDSDTNKTIFSGDGIAAIGEEPQALDIYGKISDTATGYTEIPCSEHSIHDSHDIGNDNIQCIAEELCKKDIATDHTAEALEDSAYMEEYPSSDGHGKESEIGSLPIYNDRNIMEDEFQSSKRINEPSVDKAEGTALGQCENGLVVSEDMPSLSAVRGYSDLPTKSSAQLEAFELSKGNEILDAMDIEKDPSITSSDGPFTEAGKDKLAVGEHVHPIISLDGPVGDGASREYSKVGPIHGEEAIAPIMNLDEPVGRPSIETCGEEERNAPLYAVGGGKPTVLAPGINLSMEEKRLLGENDKLREMLERLLEAGKTHMGAIANLNERVKDLERKLLQKSSRKLKPKRIARMKLHPNRVECEDPLVCTK